MYWTKKMQSMTKRNIIIGSVVSATLGLSACTSTSSDPVYTQFYSEAGSLVDAGDFGNSTLNNRLVMTGERQYTFDLARRFSTEVDSTVNFAFNSAQLDRTAQAILRQQANWIRQFPEIRFRVYGHTDAVGSNRANKSLGQRRANAVVNYFSTLGISRQRLEAVVSFGETQPLVVTQGRERRNRRTVTEVSGFVKRHPTVMDGKYAQIIYRDYVNSAVSQPTLSSTTVQGLDG
ncbi:OmpA family protein [Sulfitobacter sp. F26169L]|nr:OmpA family protein [Sulfitobacter sp. F26169L]MCX7567597.1 OmpA family protein [Sulfitobacter sp. F26169L]